MNERIEDTFRRHDYFVLSAVVYTDGFPQFFTFRLWKDDRGKWRARMETWMDEDLVNNGGRFHLSVIRFHPHAPVMAFLLEDEDDKGVKRRFDLEESDNQWLGQVRRDTGDGTAIQVCACLTCVETAWGPREIIASNIRGDRENAEHHARLAEWRRCTPFIESTYGLAPAQVPDAVFANITDCPRLARAMQRVVAFCREQRTVGLDVTSTAHRDGSWRPFHLSEFHAFHAGIHPEHSLEGLIDPYEDEAGRWFGGGYLVMLTDNRVGVTESFVDEFVGRAR